MAGIFFWQMFKTNTVNITTYYGYTSNTYVYNVYVTGIGLLLGGSYIPHCRPNLNHVGWFSYCVEQVLYCVVLPEHSGVVIEHTEVVLEYPEIVLAQPQSVPDTAAQATAGA